MFITTVIISVTYFLTEAFFQCNSRKFAGEESSFIFSHHLQSCPVCIVKPDALRDKMVQLLTLNTQTYT